MIKVISDNYRYDPQTNQWSCDVAPTTSCRTSVGVAVLDGLLYAVGGQDGVQCLNHVERSVFSPTKISISSSAEYHSFSQESPFA